MSSAAIAATTLSLLLNGVPLQSTYLRSADPPCLMTQKVAASWRAQGHRVVEKTLSQWCSVGTVIAGRWVAEQWRQAPGQTGSEGWRVHIPLDKFASASTKSASSVTSAASAASATSALSAVHIPWGLQVHDLGIRSAIQVRRSSSDLEVHHKATIGLISRESGGVAALGAFKEQVIRRSPHALVSQVGHGVTVVSAQTQATGSYSVVIRRQGRP